MEPVSPVLRESYVPFEVVYAKDQPEYKPLPVIRNMQGVVLSRWTLTPAERIAVACGADIFLSNWTFNQPLQPVYLEVGECARDLGSIASSMGLPIPEPMAFNTDHLPDNTVFSPTTIQVPDLTVSQEKATEEKQ